MSDIRPDIIGSITSWADRRGRGIVSFIDHRLELLIPFWIGAIGVVALGKILLVPAEDRAWMDMAVMALPFLLVALSPVMGFRIAHSCFSDGLLKAQPTFRLSPFGRWRTLDLLSAHSNPAFGPHGLMTSLLAGLVLNVPFRTAEFLLAVPAIHADAPSWARTIMHVMTADVILMNFFYMVCLVMALRAVPLFPRMLLFVWMADIVMQLSIAQIVASAPDLPTKVGIAIRELLHGNIEKVLISAALWLPYLALSERANVTFRRRVRA